MMTKWMLVKDEKPPEGEMVWLCWNIEDFPTKPPMYAEEWLGDYCNGKWYWPGGEPLDVEDEPIFWQEFMFPEPPIGENE